MDSNQINECNELICKCCFKIFNNFEELSLHMFYHTHYSSFYCHICRKTHTRKKPYDKNICHKNKTHFNDELCNKNSKYPIDHKMVHMNQSNHIFLDDIDFNALTTKEIEILKNMYKQCSEL